MKVVIVHGSNLKDRENMIKYNLPPQNERDWIGWIKEELKKKEIECVAPLMPENWAPVYEKWKEEFEKIDIKENDILVGWSSGGAFLTRWLGETNIKIKKLILVAPAIALDNLEEGIMKKFHNFEINSKLEEMIDEIILIESDNDSEAILEAGKIYSKKLNIEPIVLHAKGHFTGHKMGREFPELLEEILK
jgi:predicted alpha/beta hydrolase family esterase